MTVNRAITDRIPCATPNRRHSTTNIHINILDLTKLRLTKAGTNTPRTE